jgi:NTP pyrophosphatase (non-canonical NTP hydrolase)
MLRNYYPNTDNGSAMYGGFLDDSNVFCKIFEIKEVLADSIDEINVFLEQNGYRPVLIKEFDEALAYQKYPVSVLKNGHQNQFILRIARDELALPQSTFLLQQLVKFRNERDWSQFHNSKDLAIALSIEANELLEKFLWKNPDEVEVENIKEELADVFIYAFYLLEKADLNLEEIIIDKLNLNRIKYPVNKSKGNKKKYDQFEQ